MQVLVPFPSVRVHMAKIAIEKLKYLNLLKKEVCRKYKEASHTE